MKVPISKGSQGVTGLETKKLISDDVMEVGVAGEDEDDEDEDDDEDLSDLDEGRDSEVSITFQIPLPGRILSLPGVLLVS